MDVQTISDFTLRTSGRRVIVGLNAEGVAKVQAARALELPDVGSRLKAGEDFVTIHSHKGPISLPSPFTGQVVDVNWELAREPDLVVNENWMAIILPEG